MCMGTGSCICLSIYSLSDFAMLVPWWALKIHKTQQIHRNSTKHRLNSQFIKMQISEIDKFHIQTNTSHKLHQNKETENKKPLIIRKRLAVLWLLQSYCFRVQINSIQNSVWALDWNQRGAEHLRGLITWASTAEFKTKICIKMFKA